MPAAAGMVREEEEGARCAPSIPAGSGVTPGTASPACGEPMEEVLSRGCDRPWVISPVTRGQAWQPRSLGTPGAALPGGRTLRLPASFLQSFSCSSSIGLGSYCIFWYLKFGFRMAALKIKGYYYGSVTCKYLH